jgi:uncharacterized sulfatase
MMTRRSLLGGAAAAALGKAARPNMLLAIADDQSWLHTSMAGDGVVKTPSFDRVARQGVWFRQAFCPAPQCAPTRASILTGRPIWMNEEAGTHASLFPRKLTVYTELLEKAGYFVGLTGKGAGPCDWKTPGWEHNPAGRLWDAHRLDYVANFGDFLRARPAGQPFCFCLGSNDPHRPYEPASGLKAGKRLEDVKVPPFLADTREVRSDMLDYYLEIERFDGQLGRALELLEQQGELENTLVVVTADNGMPFPGAKARMYEYGWHVPMAVMWRGRVKPGQVSDALVNLMDLAPTFLEAAGLAAPEAMKGRSLMPLLEGRRRAGWDRVYGGRERHSHARFDNLGYPSRAVRTPEYLYIWNLKPERYPAGDPPLYADVDDGPSKRAMLAAGEGKYFAHCFGKAPAEELFDIRRDPGCMRNLAGEKRLERVRRRLRQELEERLRAEGDPRMRGSEIFESYPRISPMRAELGGFAEQGKYNWRYQ